MHLFCLRENVANLLLIKSKNKFFLGVLISKRCVPRLGSNVLLLLGLTSCISNISVDLNIKNNKMKSILKKATLSLAALAMIMGVAAPAMADGGKDFRIRIDKEIDLDGGLMGLHGFGLGGHGLTSAGFLGGFPAFGGFSSFGSLGGFGGLNDRTINANKQVTVDQNFNSVPSGFSITRVPGGLMGM